MPPRVLLSAWANASRNSLNVPPPKRAARSRPSGFSARRICTSAPGRVVDHLQGKQADGEIEFFRLDARDFVLVEIGAHPVLGKGRDFWRLLF